MILALTSETMTPGDVYNYGNDVIAQQLSQVQGVGQVIGISGAEEKSAVRVQVDPAYLAALGLSLEDIRTFLSKSNANLPKGSLDGGANSYTLKVNDQLFAARDYFPLVLFQNSKGTVRLRDLGRVIDSVENTRQAGWYNGRPAVLLIVFKQPGANVIATVDLIHTLIPKIERWMPPAIKLSTLSDRTQTIRASVDHIELTLLISIVLVVMVVFVFLRRFWATVIPSCTVPLALTGTFAVMYLAGYTLDVVPLAHGARRRGGLCRGRRDRRHREHRPLPRGRGEAAGRRPEGRPADRLHRPFDQRVPGGRVCPADLHDRPGRPPAA